MGGRGGEAKSWHNCFFCFFGFFGFFGKLEFWKIGILEIAFGGGGGLGVLSTSKEIENFNISQEMNKFKIPIFQNSKFPKKPKKPKKHKKTILHRPWGEEGVRQSPGTIVFFFVSLVFWKIGILEIAFGGGGGLRQNSILSVAQKSIETQYKYIETKYKQNETMQKRAAQSAPFCFFAGQCSS